MPLRLTVFPSSLWGCNNKAAVTRDSLTYLCVGSCAPVLSRCQRESRNKCRRCMCDGEGGEGEGEGMGMGMAVPGSACKLAM